MWPEKQRSDGWEGAVREGVWAAYEAGKSKKMELIIRYHCERVNEENKRKADAAKTVQAESLHCCINIRYWINPSNREPKHREQQHQHQEEKISTP